MIAKSDSRCPRDLQTMKPGVGSVFTVEMKAKHGLDRDDVTESPSQTDDRIFTAYDPIDIVNPINCYIAGKNQLEM